MPFYVTVVDAVSEQQHGVVSCIPSPSFKLPMQITWQLNGVAVTPSEIDLDASGCCARRVPPHTDCVITVTDDTGSVEVLCVRVGIADIATVLSYECVAATAQCARDGRVIADVKRMPSKCRYLWTNGVITSTPMIDNCSPGQYVATPLSMDGVPIVHVHACAPATVSIVPDQMRGSVFAGSRGA